MLRPSCPAIPITPTAIPARTAPARPVHRSAQTPLTSQPLRQVTPGLLRAQVTLLFESAGLPSPLS